MDFLKQVIIAILAGLLIGFLALNAKYFLFGLICAFVYVKYKGNIKWRIPKFSHRSKGTKRVYFFQTFP